MNAPRRRRLASLAGALVLSLALAVRLRRPAGPDSYTDSVRKHFISGCTATSDRRRHARNGIEAQQYCTCAYNAIKKNVKFSTFKQINDDLTQSGGGPLPKSFQDAYDSCDVPSG